MRFWLRSSALLLALGVTMAGCGDAPTQPAISRTSPTRTIARATLTPTLARATLTPTPARATLTPTLARATLTPTLSQTPTPPLVLSGAWAGTLSFGSDYHKSCAPQQIQTTLSQSGNAVSGHLMTACEGKLELKGTFNSPRLTADLVRADGTSIGTLNGSAYSTVISIENRDGDPWGYGDPTIGLELSR